MAIEGTQSDVLQQLGASYSQLVDYSSKEHLATLVQIGILVMITWDCITTFDGEMAMFWHAKRQVRWSVARILFMVNRRFPIIVFGLLVYWRVNRSLDNPLCGIKRITSYVLAPVYVTTGILQTVRVWSLYHRSRRVGQFLLALLACEIAGTILTKILPTPHGIPQAQLAPEGLTGCGPEKPKAFFSCTSALVMETILLTMIIIKVYQSWVHLGPMPLLRALVLDGATYYLIFILSFTLEIVANVTTVLYYPIVDTNIVIAVAVVSCNHLILSLREAAGGPDSTELPSLSLSQYPRPTSNAIFKGQASDVTDSYDDRSQTILQADHNVSADWNHKQGDLGQKPAAWYEIRPSGGSTARVSFEMN